MPTARFSCGTSTGLGTLALVFLARLKASTIGGKSVPGLAKKYSVPWSASARRKASAAMAGRSRPVGVTAIASPSGVRGEAWQGVPPDAVLLLVFYATEAGADNGPARLFGRDPESSGSIDFGQAFGEAFALGIDQRGCARAGDGVGGALRWDMARQCRADHAGLDAAVVGKAARISVAITFDQPRAFRDFARQFTRLPRRLGDQRQPRFDLYLFLLVAMAVRTQAAQLGQHQETQIAADRGRIDLHAEIDPAEPAPALAERQDRPRQERRQQLAHFLDAGLEEIVHRIRLVLHAQFFARDAAHA